MEAYWAWTGPINGVRTGLANPKHLAPEHLADAASRIEKPWETVGDCPTISLRQIMQKAHTEM